MPPQYVNMTFPRSGIDTSMAFSAQRGGTSPEGINVRTFDPLTNRARGAQRCGTSKYNSTRPNGASLYQELACLTGVGFTPPGGGMQTSTSGRVVILVAVSGGNVYAAAQTRDSWIEATNNTTNDPPLNATGVICSTQLNQKLWLVDTNHFVQYDPTNNAVNPWPITAGSYPGTDGHRPRGCCTWRGRMVLWGVDNDPQNWFMSRVSSPDDYDTNPNEPGPDQAIFGNDSPLGLIGDVVNTMIPYTDDVLIAGGDHTIYMFKGDPMDGGQIAPVTTTIGMAWGRPWCMGPDGSVYFFSNLCDVYSLIPGQAPQCISQPIDNDLIGINTGTNTIRMIWDDRFQGLHIFVTPTASAASTRHYFWEQRSGSWWFDEFANNNHNPLCCVTFDGNLPQDRRPLIGSWDGYVRAIDPEASDDDGTAIASSVIIGPILTEQSDDMMLKYLHCLMAEESNPVKYSVYVGSTAERALSSAPVTGGLWNAGRNPNSLVRRAGHSVYVKIEGLNPWALELIRATIASSGKVRMRQPKWEG